MARFVVAITGGIASGKSEVARLFARRDVAVADADVIARELVEPGQPALDLVVARFGQEALTTDGRLNRAALRRRIFDDPAARRDLERILHPRIRQRLHQACAEAAGAYAIAVIPLLAEGGGRTAYPWLSRILLVDAPRELQLQRLLQRDGSSTASAERTLQAQAGRAARQAIADDVIENTGDLADLASRVLALDSRYRELAAA